VNYIFDKLVAITAQLPYSRRVEEEADEVGLLLAAKVNRKI
jgi:Zn-dependent protease with chaperone function